MRYIMKRLVSFMVLLCLIAIAGIVFAEEPKPGASSQLSAVEASPAPAAILSKIDTADLPF
jgi:hypothetical protein